MTILFVLIYFGNPFDLVTEVSYERVPDSAATFLQNPVDADYDEQSRLYILDLDARVIFRWHADGRFDRVIGRPGSGPGEFNFNSQNGPQAFLAVDEYRIYVCDGGQWKIHHFDLQGNYVEGTLLKQPRGHMRGFWVWPGKNWILQYHHYMKRHETFEVVQVSFDGHAKTLVELDAEGLGRPEAPSNSSGIVIEAYFPELSVTVDEGNGILAYGSTGAASVTLLNHLGQQQEIDIPLPRVDVQVHHTKEFEQQSWLKHKGKFQILYPEKMPYYDHLLWVNDEGYLLFRQSPVLNKIEGYAVDSQGEVKGRFAKVYGENGGLFGSRGRLISIDLDRGGEFAIRQIRVPVLSDH